MRLLEHGLSLSFILHLQLFPVTGPKSQCIFLNLCWFILPLYPMCTVGLYEILADLLNLTQYDLP